jgi:hypothetical protein
MTPRRQNTIRPGAASIALGTGLAFLFLALSVEPSQTQVIPFWNKPCKKLMREYQTKPRHKAFAMSTSSSNDVSSCGYSSSAGSRSAAEAAAIRACHKAGGSSCVVKTSE